MMYEMFEQMQWREWKPVAGINWLKMWMIGSEVHLMKHKDTTHKKLQPLNYVNNVNLSVNQNWDFGNLIWL